MTVFILGQLCVPLTTNEGKLSLLMFEVSFSFWENYLFIPGPPRLWVTSHKKTPVANLTEKELIKTLQEGRGPGLACLQPRAEPESCGRMGSLNSPLRAPLERPVQQDPHWCLDHSRSGRTSPPPRYRLHSKSCTCVPLAASAHGPPRRQGGWEKDPEVGPQEAVDAANIGAGLKAGGCISFPLPP